MEDHFTIFVHSKNDAIFLINCLDDVQLRLLNLHFFANDTCYTVRFDKQSDTLLVNCKPFSVNIRKSGIHDTFAYVINYFYSNSL